MSDSIWNDPRISAYVLDELSKVDRQAFEAELQGNTELEAAVAEARIVTGRLEVLFAAEETPILEPDRRGAIVTPVAKSRSWRTPTIAMATAASLLMLIGGPLLVRPALQQAREASPALIAMNDSKAAAIAADDQRARYGEDSARGTALEGMSDLDYEIAQSEFKPNATVGRLARKQSMARNYSGKAPAAGDEATFNFESDRASGVRSTAQPVIAGGAIVADKLAGGKKLGATPLDAAWGAQGGRMDPRSLSRVPQPNRPRYELMELKEESLSDDSGIGPGNSGDKFEPITDNPFKRVAEHAMSTFSVDVDTASYSKTRDFLARAHQLPRPDAVRIEELINYFNYDYEPPTTDDVHPFTTHTVVTSCPWNPEHRLARIALKGKVFEKDERPRCNLVFLLDTSGSMNQPYKLPLVVEGMQMLLKQLNKKDRVAITVYAGSAGLVLDSTPAKNKKKIRGALTQLNAGGSTNGGAGIALAYQTARDNFITDGVNRVILCTDGDFNVGTTGTDALVRMVEQEARGGIFLSVLGFGMGNHNDSMLEQISGRGNGNYAFIDNQQEAHKVLVDQTSATLVTIAKDVKLQIEFNPKQVSSYRLIGYENRILAKEDFNDDKKDAGEIGAGHAVTALYEIVPAGSEVDESGPKVDALKYQAAATPTDAADSDEWMTLKLRYKAPDGDTSTLVEFPVADETVAFNEADKDLRFAAAVAGFGMQLRRSDYKGSWTLSEVQAVAEKSKGEDANGLRTEFIELVRKASELMGQE